MKRSQKSLVEIWQKRIRLDSSEPDATVAGSHTEEGSELLASSVKEAGVNIEMEPTTIEDAVRQDDSTCMSICCSDENKPYQPQEEGTLSLFVKKDRWFLPSWYFKYSWITLCTSKRKIFCFYCKFAHNHKVLSFSTRGEDAFTV